MRIRWLVVVGFLFGALGCSPDGPREFYRDALQARSELVDALCKVADESTAKEFSKTAEPRYKLRIQKIREDLQGVTSTLNGAFNRLGRDNFKKSMILPEDYTLMIEALKSYRDYCKNITYTNVRLNREMARLRVVIKATVAKKIETLLNQNAPLIDLDPGRETPGLTAIVNLFTKTENNLPNLIPASMKIDHLKKLELDIDWAEIMAFTPNDLEVVLQDFKAPPPPEAPPWVDDAFRRLGERNNHLPPIQGPTFTAAYQAVENTQNRVLLLTNGTGRDLANVQGTLTWTHKKSAGLPQMRGVSTDDWKSGVAQEIPLPDPDGVSNVRFSGTAKMGGANVRFDVGLPGFTAAKK